MAKKPGKTSGGAERGDGALAIEERARRMLGGRPGRPAGSGGAGGTGEVPAPLGGDPGQPSSDVPARAGVPIDAGALLHGALVDALHGYHQAGFAFTGHQHWQDIKPARREAAASSLSRVVEKLPPKMQGVVLAGLAWSSVAVVSYEVLAAPVLESLKIKAEERKAAAEAIAAAGERANGAE